jgi:transcriptional regulator GlxA family with amidase domain
MGRPSFSPTAEQRQEVAVLAQARVALEEIARRLGITKKTLQKHFAAELGRAEPVKAARVKTQERVNTPPPFSATPEQREVVEILAAARIGHQEIADRVGVTIAILEHHFAEELATGPAKRNSEVILATYRSAVGGSNSAQRLWQAIIAPGAGPGGAKPAKPTFAGKKADAQAAALVAGEGTEWSGLVN